MSQLRDVSSFIHGVEERRFLGQPPVPTTLSLRLCSCSSIATLPQASRVHRVFRYFAQFFNHSKIRYALGQLTSRKLRFKRPSMVLFSVIRVIGRFCSSEAVVWCSSFMSSEMGYVWWSWRVWVRSAMSLRLSIHLGECGCASSDTVVWMSTLGFGWSERRLYFILRIGLCV